LCSNIREKIATHSSNLISITVRIVGGRGGNGNACIMQGLGLCIPCMEGIVVEQSLMDLATAGSFFDSDNILNNLVLLFAFLFFLVMKFQLVVDTKHHSRLLNFVIFNSPEINCNISTKFNIISKSIETKFDRRYDCKLPN